MYIYSPMFDPFQLVALVLLIAVYINSKYFTLLESALSESFFMMTEALCRLLKFFRFPDYYLKYFFKAASSFKSMYSSIDLKMSASSSTEDTILFAPNS